MLTICAALTAASNCYCKIKARHAALAVRRVRRHALVFRLGTKSGNDVVT